MAGIVFCRTTDLKPLRDFYTTKLGCELWLHQGDIIILRHGNFLVGFHDQDQADTDSLITFFYDTPEKVDVAYQSLESVAQAPPKHNPTYQIYHFFAVDPDGRRVECQYFEHGIASYRAGDSLLASRRSVREFTDQQVSQEVIDYLIDLCRFAPSYSNLQPYYFKIVRDVEQRTELCRLNSDENCPLAEAGLAVAIICDPEKSPQHLQDGCVAAYHFMLAAWFHGLGTCWLSGFDTREAKQLLDIPASHTVIMITPLGYPTEVKTPPPRRLPDELLRD